MIRPAEGTLDGLRLDRPEITATVASSRTGYDFWLHGTADARVVELCDRCLEEFSKPISAELSLLVTPHRYDREKQGNTQEMVLFPEHEPELDLWPAVRSALLVERGIKHVCRDDCRGLCPRCGRNLNLEPCGCAMRTEDTGAFPTHVHSN